jgi:hypothetical protein
VEARALIADPGLFEMIGGKTSTVGELWRLVKDRMNLLGKADIEKRVFLRKYTGAGEVNGILDHVSDDVPVFSINDDVQVDTPGYVIAPLNDDTIYPVTMHLIEIGIPVFPLVHPLVSSKRFRETMFAGYVPASFYVPPSSPSISTEDIESFFNDYGVRVVIIKDEYGYHSGHVIPYIISPVNKLQDVFPAFKRQCDRLYDPSGIVIDEFIGGICTTIFKAHVFGSVIQEDVLEYHVKLRDLNGVFKSNDPSVPDMIENVSISSGSILDTDVDLINDAARKYFPFAMASVDFIERDGVPVIIDVNGRAGSYGERQEVIGNDGNDNSLDIVNKRCCEMRYDIPFQEFEYLKRMNKLSG